MNQTLEEAAKSMPYDKMPDWGGLPAVAKKYFIKGAEWQLNNAWNLSDNLPEIDNGQLLYEVVVLCKDYRNRIVTNIEVENLFKSGDIIPWMDIPAFV